MTPFSDAEILSAATDILDTEISGLLALKEQLGADFAAAIRALSPINGRIVVTGMGKSGHIARKIAATFASTGAPALYVHPAEASHGDLGMIAPGDVVLALSKSGETAELQHIVAHAKRFSIPVLAITCRAGSTLANAAEVAITLPAAAEACDETHAPTTSTTMMLGLGDALAVTLLRQKGFTAAQFQGIHPGGNLGAALRRVHDIMHTDQVSLPLCAETCSIGDAVSEMTSRGFGCVGLTNPAGKLTGILTDGDLRRRYGEASLYAPVMAVMTNNPKSVTPDTLAGEALRIMSDGKITALFVVADGAPVGLIHVHDCLALGVL